jgi:hypothetical protein
MAETLVEETTARENIYGITPELRAEYRKKLEQIIRENNVGIFTEKDFDSPKDEKTQAKIRAEVDEFLQMREQWRKENRERNFD